MVTPKRKASRRDSPFIFLALGVAIGLFASAAPWAASVDIASKADLILVSGVIEDVYRKRVSKGRDKLDILLRATDHLHHLTQDDLSNEVVELKNLRPGDSITALVKPDSFGRNLEWFWEIKKESAYILSYEEVQVYYLRHSTFAQHFAMIGGAISATFLIMSILLRKHFGVWRDAT